AGRSAVPHADPEIDGSARGARQDSPGAPRSGACENGAQTEAGGIGRRDRQAGKSPFSPSRLSSPSRHEDQRMSQKAEKVGVVVSDKMQKSIVVAVEWQVRHGLYGKTERRTSKFMVHDEVGEAKIGDVVAIVETRPMSRRKRWALARVVRQT